MSKHSNETYELAHILTNTAESLLRAEVLMKSPGIGKGGKHFIKTSIINRLNGVKNDVLHKLGSEAAEVMKADVLNEETALQLREVTDRFLELYKEDRDKVEAFIAKLLAHELSNTQNAAA